MQTTTRIDRKLVLRRADELIGYGIEAVDDSIGTVHDFYFSDDTWAIRYMIVDTGPWLFGRRVLISPAAFDMPTAQDEVFRVNLTKQQVEESPEIDLDKPVSRQQEKSLHNHYRWPVYWLPNNINGMGINPAIAAPVGVPLAVNVASETEVQEKDAEPMEGDPTLRSMREVIGYNVQATDGEIGHVEDFFVDDDSWFVRYMLVDTRNWLPGRKVVVSPGWIGRVSWHESNVHVDVTREQVESSPQYDPTQPVSRDYESRLFSHYGAHTYWL